MTEKQNQNQDLDFLTINFLLEMVHLLPNNYIYAGDSRKPKPETLNYIFTQWVEARGDVLPKSRFAVKNSFDRALRILNLSSKVFYDKYRNKAVYKGITLDLNLGSAIEKTDKILSEIEKTAFSSESVAVSNIIQTETDPDFVKITFKFDKLVKYKLFVLNQTIINGFWSVFTMSDFEAVMTVARVDLTESYVRYFPVMNLEKHLDLKSAHPSNSILSNLRDWTTTIPVLCAGVIQRLNICVKNFSLIEAENLTEETTFCVFPTSYSTVESGDDRQLVPLATNKNITCKTLTWDLLDRGSQDLIASKLLTQEYNLQNYSLVRVEIVDIYSGIIAMFLSNSALLKLSRSYVQLSNSNNKGADWILATEPFKYLFDLERISNVFDIMFSEGYDNFYKIPALRDLVTEIYPDTTTLSQSDFDVKVQEVGLKILDNLIVLEELRSFLDLVDNIPTVFPVVSKKKKQGVITH